MRRISSMALLLETRMDEPWGWLVAELKRCVAQPCSIVLAGPPGSGKWTAIKAAVGNYYIREVSLEFDGEADPKAIAKAVHQLNLCRAMALAPRPTDVSVQALTVVFGIECFSQNNNLSNANLVMQAAFKHERCIIHLNNPTGLDVQPPAVLLRAKGFSWASLDRGINSLRGHRVLNFDDRLALKRTGGASSKDLRKVLLNAEALIHAKELGGGLASEVDAAVHQWFDTARFLRGERVATLQPEKLDRCGEWIRANIGQTLSLEDAATFSQHMAEMDGFHGEDEWRCKAGLRGHVMQGLGLIMPRTGTRVNELINPRAFDVPLHTPSQARAAIYKLEAPIFKVVPGEEIEADDHNSLMHRLHGNGAAAQEAESSEPATMPSELAAKMQDLERHNTSVLQHNLFLMTGSHGKELTRPELLRRVAEKALAANQAAGKQSDSESEEPLTTESQKPQAPQEQRAANAARDPGAAPADAAPEGSQTVAAEATQGHVVDPMATPVRAKRQAGDDSTSKVGKRRRKKSREVLSEPSESESEAGRVRISKPCLQACFLAFGYHLHTMS